MPRRTTLFRACWTWVLPILGLASTPLTAQAQATQAQPVAPSGSSAVKNAVPAERTSKLIEVAPQDAVLPALNQGPPGPKP